MLIKKLFKFVYITKVYFALFNNYKLTERYNLLLKCTYMFFDLQNKSSVIEVPTILGVTPGDGTLGRTSDFDENIVARFERISPKR